jgi:hypothetical protein
VRKSDDESDYSIDITTTSPGIPFVQVPGSWSEVLTFGSTDPKFVLDYSFNENSMAYISVSSGYKEWWLLLLLLGLKQNLEVDFQKKN